MPDSALPGWDAGWAATFAPFAAEGRRPGRVVAVHRDTSIVRDEDGDTARQVSGIFRRTALGVADFPTVGDWVALGADGVIVAVLPRRTVFKRIAADASRRDGGLNDEQVMAANVDLALLVAGLDHDFNLRRIERYLAVARSSGIDALIVLTKADVADDVAGRRREIAEIAPDRPVVAVSSRTGAGLDELRGYLRPGLTAAILGSSGVGKSTLVNALLGEERQRTASVRESDSRGRHTTTHRELFELAGGALLVDTPGIRALEVLGADEGVEESFDEIADIVAGCRFANCGHVGEPDCAVQAALADGRITTTRFASWRKLQAETARIGRDGDPRARAEARRTHRTADRASRARERREEREEP